MRVSHRFAVAAGVLCRRRFVPSSLRFSLVMLSALGASRTAPAANGTWGSGAGTGAWQTVSNWVFGRLPGATSGTTNPDTATFNGTGAITQIVPDAGRNLENITFDTVAPSYTIGTTTGNSLLLTSGGTIQIASTFFGGANITETVNAPLTLEGSYTVADNSAYAGDLLDFGGAITSPINVSSTLTVSGSSTTAIAGAVGNGFAGGFIGLVMNSSGTLTLSGNNAFSGGVAINSGTVQLGNPAALNTGVSGYQNSVTFGTSGLGTLSLNGKSVTVGGLTGSGVLQNASASSAVLTINNGGTHNFAGVLQDGSGGGTLALLIENVYASGFYSNLTLSGNNTFTGGLTVQSGTTLQVPTVNNQFNGGPLGANSSVTLGGGSQTGTMEYTGATASSNMPFSLVNGIFGGGGAFQVDNAATALTLSGTIGGGGGLTVAGQGTLVLGGANTFTGGVTMITGTLQIGNAGALNSTTPNAVTFGLDSTATLNLSGFSVICSSLSSSGGTPIVQFGPSSGGGSATLTINQAGSTNYGGVIQDGAAGSSLSIVKSGAGSLTLAGNSTFTGGLTLNAGQLNINNGGTSSSNSAIGTGLFTIDGGTTMDNTSGSPATLATNNPQQWNGDFTFVGSADLNLGSGNVTLGANRQVTVDAHNLTVGGIISGAGLSLTKVGPGTLTLAGANAYTSGTIAIAGSLNTTAGGTLGPGSLTISAGNGITSAVNLGNSQTVSSLSGTLAGSGFATLSIGSGTTLTDNQSGGNTNFQGVLVNSGTFAKSGSSSLEINNAPTLNANSSLLVKGGKLRFDFVTGTATIGAGVTATISSGATLELAGEVSALSEGPNRVNIKNNSSAAAGLLVSGTHQQLGNIDGSGVTEVNPESDLTANHVVQSALVIGGTAGSSALVTIDASDASGNPLAASSGFVLAGSLETSTSPVSESGSAFSPGLSGTSHAASLAIVGNTADGASAVPEPSTLSLALALVGAVFGVAIIRRTRRRQVR